MLHEALGHPLAQILQKLLLKLIEREALAEELEWPELKLSRLAFNTGWRKEGPGTVEEDVRRELLGSLVVLHTCSVNSNNISNSLADWQILESVRKHYQSAIVDGILIFVNEAALISYLH